MRYIVNKMIKTRPGDLVEIVEVPDQNVYIRLFVGKLGVVIENVTAESSPNIWKLLIDDRCINFHRLDFKVVQRSFRND